MTREAERIARDRVTGVGSAQKRRSRCPALLQARTALRLPGWARQRMAAVRRPAAGLAQAEPGSNPTGLYQLTVFVGVVPRHVQTLGALLEVSPPHVDWRSYCVDFDTLADRDRAGHRGAIDADGRDASRRRVQRDPTAAGKRCPPRPARRGTVRRQDEAFTTVSRTTPLALAAGRAMIAGVPDKASCSEAVRATLLSGDPWSMGTAIQRSRAIGGDWPVSTGTSSEQASPRRKF